MPLYCGIAHAAVCQSRAAATQWRGKKQNKTIKTYAQTQTQNSNNNNKNARIKAFTSLLRNSTRSCVSVSGSSDTMAGSVIASSRKPTKFQCSIEEKKAAFKQTVSMRVSADVRLSVRSGGKCKRESVSANVKFQCSIERKKEKRQR